MVYTLKRKSPEGGGVQYKQTSLHFNGGEQHSIAFITNTSRNGCSSRDFSSTRLSGRGRLDALILFAFTSTCKGQIGSSGTARICSSVVSIHCCQYSAASSGTKQANFGMSFFKASMSSFSRVGSFGRGWPDGFLCLKRTIMVNDKSRLWHYILQTFT